MNAAQLRMQVLGIAGRLLKWSTIRGQESRYGYLRASLPPADPVLGEEEHDQPVRLMQQFGDRSQPPVGSECVVAAMRGSAQNAVVIATENMGYGPTDLANGEKATFNICDKDGVVCRMTYRADGNILIHVTKDGANVTIIPSATGKVRLGDGVAGNLDAVALFTKLKADFDALVSAHNTHVHPAGTPNTGTPSVTANALSSSVASANVQAKKP